jgi:malonate transporter and related proteins
MELAVKAILPIFVIIVAGFVANKTKILGANSERIINKFVFYFALPAALFIPLAEETIANIINLKFIGIFGLSSIIIYIVAFAWASLFRHTTLKQVSVTALSAACPNTAFLGIPILVALFGQQAMLPVAIATMLMYFVTMVAIFVIEASNHKLQDFSWKIVAKILHEVVGNVLFIAIFSGILFALFKIKLPFIVSSFGHKLGSVAGPCALFAVGQTLARCRIFTAKLESIVIIFLKLILHPLLVLLFIFIFHLSGLWAACAFIFGAIPSAAMSYIVATRYHINPEKSASLIFETTLLSVVTLPISIMIVVYMWPGVIVV